MGLPAGMLVGMPSTILANLPAEVPDDRLDNLWDDLQDDLQELPTTTDEANGEIETAHPGYMGSQVAFYVGNFKGVGRSYQQTFIDTYSKVARCKLSTSKTPITAADLLNDRGSEFCGRADQYDYQLYLAINDIDQTKTKAMSLQTKGICERFHKTILQEFYQVTFGKPYVWRPR